MPPATRARFRPQACDWQLLLLLSLDCDNFAACCDLRPALTLSRALCVLCDLPHRRPSIEEVGSLIVAQIMTQLEKVSVSEQRLTRALAMERAQRRGDSSAGISSPARLTPAHRSGQGSAKWQAAPLSCAAWLCPGPARYCWSRVHSWSALYKSSCLAQLLESLLDCTLQPPGIAPSMCAPGPCYKNLHHYLAWLTHP